MQQPNDIGTQERPRKIARPTTAEPGGGGVSRNGITQNTNRSEIRGNVPLLQDIRTPEPSALQNRMQQRPATANGRTDLANAPRPSLSSLLDGNNSTSSSAERYKSDNREQQQQRVPMALQSVKVAYGEPYGTPGRQLDGSRASSLIPPPTGSGQGQGQGFALKPLNAGSSERPLTPSTLFLIKAQQSQYFPRQQQEQQQQIRQQHQLQQQVSLR